LHRETQAPQDAPDLRLAKLDAVHPLDERAHSLERPQFGAEAMLGGFVQKRPSQRLQLRLIQACRTASRGHGAQRVDATFIEHRLPRVRRLPSHADRMRRLCRRLAASAGVLPASSIRPARNRRRTVSSNRFFTMCHTQYLPSIGTTHEGSSGCH
jgi:hypothetical protein